MTKNNKHPRCGGSTHLITGEDLAPLILSRLPARSVVRFRCVCRLWLALTSEASFLRYHTLSHPHPPVHGLITRVFNRHVEAQPIPGRSLFLPDRSLAFMADLLSVDGGLGNSSSGLFLFKSELPSTYYVCNPTTMDYYLIPNPPITRINAMALFFDPSSPACRAPLLHYKVVCIGVDYSQDHVILIYNSLTDSWRVSGEPLSRVVVKYSPITRAASCGGAVHWLGRRRVVSFQLESEQLRLTGFPPTRPGTSTYTNRDYFGSSGGDRLHLIERYEEGFDYDSNPLHIFELKEDYSGWILLYCIHPRRSCLDGLDPILKRSFMQIKPVGFLRQVVEREETRGAIEEEEEEEEDLLLLKVGKVIIVSFNFQTKSSARYHGPSGCKGLIVTPIAHSLYPLHHHHHHHHG